MRRTDRKSSSALKKISLVLVLAITLSFTALCFSSCGDDVEYENITYRENGIEFFLPNSMRRFNEEGYDFYFSNMAAGVIFTALKLDQEFLESIDIEYGITAEAYANEVISRNGMEKDKLYYNYDERRNHYNFRYSYVDQNDISVFYYIVITGEPDNLWYIEMCCEEEQSSDYLSTFEVWKKNIKTYSIES